MASPVMKSSQLSSTQQSKFKTNDINLNAQILRLQTVACSKQIANVWHLDQSQICQYFQNHISLPFSKIDAPALFEATGARIIKTQHKIYMGQVLNKKKHGQGIAVYRDGRIYEGEFYQNQKSGFGCELYANGNLYIGNFSQNKKHTKGSFYWFSLCTAACTKDSSPKIEQYHGDWWGGLPDGEGEHQKLNGDFYIGGFKNGLKHGNGVQYYANGDLYRGQYVNGLAQGYGEYSWSDGSTFKGDFKQGYRNGYGVWESKGGKEQYKGHYLLDRKHGYGIYDWGNGSIYKGHYLEDIRAGQGQLHRNGELIYEGLWQNGERVDFDYDQKITPPKRAATRPAQKNSTNVSASRSTNFRVKQSKIQYKSVVNRNNSAATVKKDNFQVNFKLVDSNASTHRGCQACNRRPSTGEYLQKYKRSRMHKFQHNPQLTQNYN